MKITRTQLRDLIINEAPILGTPLGSSHRQKDKHSKSEMKQFSETKSGKKLQKQAERSSQPVYL